MKLKIFPFLSSIRLLLSLLGVIGSVSLIGIVIPQSGEEAQYIHKYGSSGAAFIGACGWDHVFSSVWFIVPLSLLCLNLLLCIVNRIRFLWGVSVSGGTSRRTGAAGSLLLHAGLLFLVAGGVVQHYRGETRFVVLAEGEKQPAEGFGFSLALKHFSIERDAKGAVINYRSDLQLFDENDSVVLHGETRVNTPLAWKRFYMYQTTYGYLPDAVENIRCMVVDSAGNTLLNGVLPFRQPAGLPNRDIVLLCSRFAGDFTMDIGSGEVSSRSGRHDNPAFRFSLFKGDSVIATHWIFLNHSGSQAQFGEYSVKILSYDPSYYSGVQIKKKAGTGLVWTGLMGVSLGLMVVFLFPLRKPDTPSIQTTELPGNGHIT